MLDFSVTFFITIINIAVLFLVLRKILFKPVTKFMADRTKRISDAIEQAEKDKALAKTLLEQYETRLENSRLEADAIIKAATEKARREADLIIKEGKAAAEKAMNDARIQMEAERHTAFALFIKDAAVLVTAACGRLLGRELKDEDNRQFARMLIKEAASAEFFRGNS